MSAGRQQHHESNRVPNDPCLSRVGLRVEHWEMSGYTAAIGIAKLLGQDEIVAMLTEDVNDINEEQPARKSSAPAAMAYAEMADEDAMDVARVLKLCKTALR